MESIKNFFILSSVFVIWSYYICIYYLPVVIALVRSALSSVQDNSNFLTSDTLASTLQVNPEDKKHAAAVYAQFGSRRVVKTSENNFCCSSSLIINNAGGHVSFIHQVIPEYPIFNFM